MGKIRTNNEDNFYFDGKNLEMYNSGSKQILEKEESTDHAVCLGVFDGMGGESNGEKASYYAAITLKEELAKTIKKPKEFLQQTIQKMNEWICQEAQKDKTFMGTTAAMMYIFETEVYICNIGDSRIYRLRENQLMQISEDHVEKIALTSGKPALTQNLGIPKEEMEIEPYIAKGTCRKGDIFLICTDGLTDMVKEEEIYHILKQTSNMKQCAEDLITRALENGGKDNITVIVCKIV